MKSDVKEILSLSAGKSYSYILATLIHACPTSYSYKPAQYLTFRKQGGEMETLYEVEAVFSLKPHDKDAIQRLNPQYRDRVQNYINYRMREWPFPDREDRRFYVLSETDQIDLPHKPQLIRNIQGHCYFTLDELLSGSKIVQVASKR
jgi:hypothetical protein